MSIRNDITDVLVEEYKISKDMAYNICITVLDTIHKTTLNAGKVRLGSHSFKVLERAARMGRNPRTGEAIKIKASRKVVYKNTAKATKEEKPAKKEAKAKSKTKKK